MDRGDSLDKNKKHIHTPQTREFPVHTAAWCPNKIMYNLQAQNLN